MGTRYLRRDRQNALARFADLSRLDVQGSFGAIFRGSDSLDVTARTLRNRITHRVKAHHLAYWMELDWQGRMATNQAGSSNTFHRLDTRHTPSTNAPHLSLHSIRPVLPWHLSPASPPPPLLQAVAVAKRQRDQHSQLLNLFVRCNARMQSYRPNSQRVRSEPPASQSRSRRRECQGRREKRRQGQRKGRGEELCLTLLKGRQGQAHHRRMLSTTRSASRYSARSSAQRQPTSSDGRYCRCCRYPYCLSLARSHHERG